jgi:hypothetical protein
MPVTWREEKSVGCQLGINLKMERRSVSKRWMSSLKNFMVADVRVRSLGQDFTASSNLEVACSIQRSFPVQAGCLKPLSWSAVEVLS